MIKMESHVVHGNNRIISSVLSTKHSISVPQAPRSSNCKTPTWDILNIQPSSLDTVEWAENDESKVKDENDTHHD